jgi:hypothetical protein
MFKLPTRLSLVCCHPGMWKYLKAYGYNIKHMNNLG